MQELKPLQDSLLMYSYMWVSCQKHGKQRIGLKKAGDFCKQI